MVPFSVSRLYYIWKWPTPVCLNDIVQYPGGLPVWNKDVRLIDWLIDRWFDVFAVDGVLCFSENLPGYVVNLCFSLRCHSLLICSCVFFLPMSYRRLTT